MSKATKKQQTESSNSSPGLDDFKLIKKLGDGAQGQVWLTEKLTGSDKGKMYAMKIFSKSKTLDSEQSLECLLYEREILKIATNLKFLVTMFYAFQSRDYLYIVMDFAQGGEMFSLLRLRGSLGIGETKFYIAEIILALEQLHKFQIVYRDLKLENILLDAQGHVVIADFGLSVELNLIEHNSSKLFGTSDYLPPESLDDKLPYGFGIDWWTVGILTHELLTGCCPFTTKNDMKFEEISYNITHEAPKISAKIQNPRARDFISKLLVKNANYRLGAVNDAEDLKAHPFFEGIDWNLMFKKQYPAPIVFNFKDKYDVAHFDEEFTAASDTFKDDSSTVVFDSNFPNFTFFSQKIDKPKEIRKVQNDHLNMIYNDENVMLIGKQKFRKLYLDNKYRDSLIENRYNYLK